MKPLRVALILAVPVLAGCGGDGGGGSSARLFAGPLMYVSTQVELYGLGDAPKIRDLNGDGLNDIFYVGWPDGYNGQLYLRRGDRRSLLDEPDVVASCDAMVDGDLNADGRPDLACFSGLVVRGSEGVQFQILFSQPDGEFVTSQVFTVPTQLTGESLSVGDADGDGLGDIFGIGDEQAVVLLNRRSSFELVTSPVENFFGFRFTRALDANQDGFDDLFFIDTWHSIIPTVNLMLSGGDGSLSAARSLIPGEYPVWPVVDCNGDGFVDVLSTEDRTITVHLGDATASYSQARTTVLSSAYDDFYITDVVADFDEDGFPDLLLAHGYYDGSVFDYGLRIARGLGDGTFSPVPGPVTIVDQEPTWVGDVNNDGHLDLLAPSDMYTFQDIYFGNGDGAFGLHGQSYIPVAPASSFLLPTADPWHAPDLDGDGNRDLVTVNYPATAIRVQFGRGDGNFDPQDFPTPAGTDFYGPRFADLDDDGDLDIVDWVTSTEKAIVMRNDGNRNLVELPPMDISTGGGSSASFIGDIDGDGHTDLLYPDLSILWGLGNAAFESPSTIPANFGSGGWTVTAGEVNGDLRKDLIAVLDTEGVRVWPSTGPRAFGAPVTTDLGRYLPNVEFGRFDADSRLDGVSFSQAIATGRREVVILRGMADASFEQSQVFAMPEDTSDGVCHIGDLDNDHDQDVVCAYVIAPFGGRYQYFPVFGMSLMNDGHGHFSSVDDGQVCFTDGTMNSTLTDLNGDRVLDLILLTYSTDLNVAFGVGNGTFDSAYHFTAPPMGSPALFGDFDRDSDQDAATIENRTLNHIVVMKNQLVRY